MGDKDFEVLQTALSPEVSESEEQVCCFEHYSPIANICRLEPVKQRS